MPTLPCSSGRVVNTDGPRIATNPDNSRGDEWASRRSRDDPGAVPVPLRARRLHWIRCRGTLSALSAIPAAIRRDDYRAWSSRTSAAIAGLAALALVMSACGSKSNGGSSTTAPPAHVAERPGGTTTASSTPAPASLKACMVLDTGGVDDKSFNQSS